MTLMATCRLDKIKSKQTTKVVTEVDPRDDGGLGLWASGKNEDKWSNLIHPESWFFKTYEQGSGW